MQVNVHGPAVDLDGHNPNRIGQRARDISRTAIDLYSGDLYAAQVKISVPRSAVNLEVPSRMRVKLNTTAISAASIAHYNHASVINVD